MLALAVQLALAQVPLPLQQVAAKAPVPRAAVQRVRLVSTPLVRWQAPGQPKRQVRQLQQ